jgi:hypothetical protein
MHSAAVDFRFRRLTGLTVLLAFLFALSRSGGTQNITYSHGTSTCLAENDTHGFKLVLTEIDRCGANLYPRLEIEIRQLPIKIQKSIIIGPDNWAFRCLSTDEPCEQVLSGEIVFDQLEEGSKAGSKTEGRYELTLRGGAGVERGKFTVHCAVPCNEQLNVEPQPHAAYKNPF